MFLGFPCGSAGKESAFNVGDLSSIPGLGYPLQYSWASLVAQLVKNPPAMRETWVRSLGWEDPLEKGKATHSSILAWRIWVTKSWTWLSDFDFIRLSNRLYSWLRFFLQRTQRKIKKKMCVSTDSREVHHRPLIVLPCLRPCWDVLIANY